MKDKKRQILLHVAGGIIFLTLPLLFAPEREDSTTLFNSLPTQREFATYVLLLGFFYLNYFWLIPRLFFQKKYVSLVLWTLACFLVITFLPMYLFSDGQFWGGGGPPRPRMDMLRPDGFRGGPPRRPRREFFWFFMVSHHFLLFLVVAFFSYVLKISNRWKQSEQEKLQAEVSYLKAQINPHFLFNTLNSIYALAILKSDQTPSAVTKLSGMMRYVLSEAENEWVALEKEIVYIRSYIELQQLRFGDTFPLTFEVHGSPVGKKIAPLLLIPFVENAFKHGINAEEEASIHIKIEIEDEDLKLKFYNRKVSVQLSPEETSGVGLQNTRNRLKLLYPGRYVLLIEDQADSFLVNLTLHLS